MFPSSSSLIDLAKSRAWEEVRRQLHSSLPLPRGEEPPKKKPRPTRPEITEIPREFLSMTLLPDDIVPLLLKRRERSGGVNGGRGFPRVVDTTSAEVTFEETVLVHICGFLPPRGPTNHEHEHGSSPRGDDDDEPGSDPAALHHIASGWETFLRVSSPAAIEAILNVYSANYRSGRLRPKKKFVDDSSSSSEGEKGSSSSSSPLSSAKASRWVGQLLERHFAIDDITDREQFYTYEQKLGDLVYVSSLDELRDDVPNLYDIWRKAELLLKFRHETSNCGGSDDEGGGGGGNCKRPEQPFELTPHQFLRNGYPLVLLWLYGRMCPEQFRHRDEFGRIPLHWAYLPEGRRRPAPSRPRAAGPSFPGELACLNAGNNAVARVVSNVYADGASCHDGRGRLPLATHIVEGGLRGTDLHDLRRTIERAPRILRTRDVETGFFPFMLAASSLRAGAAAATATRQSRDEHEERDAFCASVIYVLLRENPAVLTLLPGYGGGGATCIAAEEPNIVAASPERRGATRDVY